MWGYEKRYEIYCITHNEDTVFKQINKIDAIDVKIRDARLIKIKAANQQDDALRNLHDMILNGFPENERQIPEKLKVYWKDRDILTT